MDNKEAIKLLKTILRTVCLGNQKFIDAVKKALSALEKQEQIVDASCETCKHKNRSGNTYPCFGCFRASDQDDYYEHYTEDEDGEQKSGN